MKRFFTTLFLLVLVGASMFAQAPEKFSYQSVVRNVSNALVINAPVGVRVSILQGGVNGTIVYMETHTAVTNANGLLTLDIGSGSVQQGVFADIDWASGLYFLKTETDPDGGSDYSITSTQQLLSVPYALYSKESGNGFSGDYNDLTNLPQIPQIPADVSVFNNDAGYLTSYTETDPQFNAWDKDYNDLTNKPTIPTVPTNVSAFNNDAGYITMDSIPAIPAVPTNVSAFVNDAGYLTDYTEQQVLSISNDTLFLTGGSFVKLPASANCDTTGMAALLARVDQLERPSISTLSVENVSCHNAYLTGRLINSGVSWISACGFCWSTVHNPTLAHSHVTVTTGLGTFNTNLTGLEAGTTYYVRAYATNDAGTTYGEELSFTTTSNAFPSVTTKTVTNILSDAAVCGGNVTSEGCLTVTARGVCWSTSQNPTVSDSHTTDGNGIGSFNSSITGLNAGTTYYVRAYATNSMGTAYGTQRSFTTLTNLPTVTTNTVSNITETTATCGGNVTTDGGAMVTARGVCWSTSQHPTINDSHTTDGNGTGAFTSSLTGLFAGITYYVRAYATNSQGTAYGNEVSFTTSMAAPVDGDAIPCPGTPTVTDHEGNVYNTVQIGNQCWTKENMRAYTSPSTGAYLIPAAGTESSYTGKQARWIYDDSTYYNDGYGLLYNWNAAMDTFNTSYGELSVNTSSSNAVNVTFSGYRRGICPMGWHVPSDAEWTQLTNYVSSQSQYVCGNDSTQIAKALASTTGWWSASCGEGGCGVGDNPSTNNATGFSAVGASCYYSYNDIGYYDNPDSIAYFWSATQHSNNIVSGVLSMSYCSTSYVWGGGGYKSCGYSVRCLRDSVSGGGTSATLPTVTTSAVSNITATTATCGGNVTSDGGATVTVRGVCWSTSQNPTVNDSHTTDGNGAGSFNSSITGLTAGTTYYVRAYATNSMGTAYGTQRSFTTSTNLPTVTTSMVSNITENTATCGGNVTADGGATVTARGVCWSISHNPTLSDSHTTDGSGTGAFTSSLSGLFAGITYYVRAYATNSVGTAYGAEVYFTPNHDGQPCPNAATITDYDGNTYNTVHIGQQCWMKQNLRTTHYADGTYVHAGGSEHDESYPYYYDYSSSGIALSSRGYLYNWPAVMHHTSYSSANPSGVQGICPNGWHVPSDAEWTQLINYVSSQSQYVCGDDSNYIAKVLAATTGWDTTTVNCAVGNGQGINNATGFSAVPAGLHSGSSLVHAGLRAYFWSSSSQFPADYYAYYCNLNYNNANVYRGHSFRYCGMSVRCLRDEYSGGATSLPTVTTKMVSSITAISATGGGIVTSDGGAIVTARGVCWSTTQNPTVSNSHTTDGSGMDIFTSSLTGLTANTTYYVRAYATNSVGTAYGAQRSFTTSDPSFTCGTSNVTDHEGNVYATRQIGSQCWMRDNLRTTTSPSTGTYLIPAAGTGHTYTGKQARWYNNDSTTYAPMNYGLLYNWNAAVDTFNTACGETSENIYANHVSVIFTGHRRGICPYGWHVPSDAEWAQLIDFVSGQSQYVCGNDSSYIAKALAASTGWNTSANTCAVGNGQGTNNATGFSAVPAGLCGGSSYYAGASTRFWSSSEYSDHSASACDLSYNSASVWRYNDHNKTFSHSVRCLRD